MSYKAEEVYVKVREEKFLTNGKEKIVTYSRTRKLQKFLMRTEFYRKRKGLV